MDAKRIFAALVWAGVLVAGQSRAATVSLESSLMGPASIPGGQSLSSTQLVGWRFTTTKPIAVSEVGGHLLQLNGNLFTAIVKLSGPTALPAGAPFSDTEVVANAVFTPPSPSAETFVPLSVTLAPGNYALVFGSGWYEGTGTGAMPNNSQQHDVAPTTASSYLSWRQTLPGHYEWIAGGLDNLRFVVRGRETGGAADFNVDGVIDGQDLVNWRGGFGMKTGGTTEMGDADGDGDVDGVDFLAWQRTVKPTAPTLPAATGVPEPPTIALAGLLAIIGAHSVAVNRAAK